MIGEQHSCHQHTTKILAAD